MTDPIDQRKRELRQEIKRRIAAISDEDRHAASVAACHRLIGLDAFENASVVMLYMPLPDEIDVTSIAIRCFKLGKTVCVPAVDWERHEMRAVEVRSLDDEDMQLDEHGIRTPRADRPVLPEMIDLVVVPGRAFDISGDRLGRGRGYYDRFLSRLRPGARTVGLGFDVQVVPEVPAGVRDMVVDMLITDRRTTTSQSRSRK